MPLCDSSADDIAHYQASRLEQGAAAKTVNLEVGTLRAILQKNRLWAAIQPEVRMLRVREDVGRAISRDEEAALLNLEVCRASRSRSLYPAVLLALNTCVGYSEIRLLRWEQIDLNSCTPTVGLSKPSCTTVMPQNRLAAGRKLGNRQKLAPAFPVDFTTCGILAALGCLKRRAIFRCGSDHGVEPLYDGEDAEAVWPHWTSCAATSSQRAKSGQFSGRWGTKLGTLKSHTCGNFLTN
jgi:hypothetical protein